MRLHPLGFLFAALLFDCATLDPIDAATCGNGVIDATEDCDTYPSHCGAPGSGAGACRLQCGASLPPCPEGWGCSVQGFCREPTGTFDSAGGPLSTGVSTMIVGDFDADGRTDILASGPRASNGGAKVRAHFFDDAAALAAVQPFLAPFASPVVRDFDGDGRSDFAFGVGGLGIMLGQPDRTFAPVVFPSFKQSARILPILVGTGTLAPPGGAPSTYLFAGSLPGKDGQMHDILAASESASEFSVSLPGPPQSILASAWGPHVLDAVPESTCGEVVLAFDTPPNTTVYVYSPCTKRILPGANGEAIARWWPERKPVELTLSARAEKGVLLADENLDGHVDIILGTSSGIFVAYGDGTRFAPPTAAAAFEDMPLAAGDLNADGYADYVMPRGIRLSQRAGAADAGPASVGYAYLQIGRPTKWARAVIGKLNLDPYPDIIAAADDQPDIDFISGTGSGSFTGSTISTSGQVTQLATGDLDGDQIVDVVFAQKRAVSGENEIAVAYGRVVGPPEAARSIGKFASVVHMDSLEQSYTVMRNLAIFAETPAAKPSDPPTVSFAILLGSGDRQPIAPLLLYDTNAGAHPKEVATAQRDWRVQAVMAGAFEDAKRTDMAVVAVGYRYRTQNGQPLPPPYPAGMWAARGRGPADFETPVEALAVDPLVARLAKGDSFLLFTAAGDIDSPPNGVDEVVVFSDNAQTQGPALVVARPSAAGALTTIKVDVPSLAAENQLALLDVDGDGLRDVVLLAGPSDAAKLLVFLNDGRGGFPTVPLEVSVPAIDGKAKRDVVTGFTQLTTAAARPGRPRRRDLVLVTARRVLLASIGTDRASFDVRALAAFGDLAEGTGVAAGDFDGDGVEDIAVADKGAIRIARQLSRLR